LESEVVGTCGFHTFEERRAAIGYDLSRAQWGKGIAREAVAAILDYGFGPMGLEQVDAWVLPANTASIRLLERLGFLRTRIDQGEARETVYSLTVGEWETSRSVP
jgi:ribosomal-protein-alanine N-acetyltransferase